MRGLAAKVSLGLLLLAAPASRASELKVRPLVAPDPAPRTAHKAAVPPRAGAAALTGEMLRIERARLERWRSFPDVVSRPGAAWHHTASRRRGWQPPAARAARAFGADTLPPPVAFIRIDFLHDRGNEKSTGNGHFDLSGPDTLQPPIDRAPHNRTFYLRHLEALRRFYGAQSFGNAVIEGDVWPRSQNGAYSLPDMADFGPWEFSQSIYGAAVHMFRTMLFAADSQSIALGDRIPWDAYDRFVVIHAGGDLQSDVRRDSPEDIPSFTLGVLDSDAVIFPDSTTRPIDRASVIPETINQDGYYGAINGVLAHECGHNFFGFADVYDVETGRPIVGYWSLMDSGNLVGTIVALPDGTELYATGLVPPSVDPLQRTFITPRIVPHDVAFGDTIALRAFERVNDLRRVRLSSDEYLLLENRYVPTDSIALDQDDTTRVVLGPKLPDRFEYDSLLPGGGILVWHIDESVIPLESYFPVDTALRANPDLAWNTNPFRLGVSIIEGDGLMDLGDPGSPYILGARFDPFFKSNNPSLSDTTSPDLRPHIGTRPHIRLDFLDDPDSLMHVSAFRTWQLKGFPVSASFPIEGPALLAVDADGDRQLEACWAGGDTASADSAALFAVRADGTGLGGGSLAFAHLDHRPLRVMAAIATGELIDPQQPATGPALFAVTTRADAADAAGGRVWLIDHLGHPVPGWPAPLPAVATTPPVIVGLYPQATVYVGCADGRVYALSLDGSIVAQSPALFGGAVTGRLAVDDRPGVTPPAPLASADALVAAGGADGKVAVVAFGPTAGAGRSAAVLPGWPRPVGPSGFAPDLLWVDFNGSRLDVVPPGPPPAACGGGRSLVVHHADKLWAFCTGGDALPGWGHSFGDTLVDALGAGDADGDGYPEVLTQTQHSGVMFVNVSGYPSPGWPKRSTPEDFKSGSPALAIDVDGDGRSEIVSLNASGVVTALGTAGGTPAGWPFATGVGAAGALVAADLNRDGMLDIVAPDRLGRLWAYTIPVPGGRPALTSWTVLGGDPGRSSNLPIDRTTAPGPIFAGPLVHGSFKAFPNPARRHPVSFAYTLTEPAQVEFRIVDASGHQVASFMRQGRPADNLEVWDPGALPAGLYVARVRFRGAGTERTEFVPVGLLR